ncbi:MAG: sulfotransferase domain-containing protein [Bacteroidota bacterium]
MIAYFGHPKSGSTWLSGFFLGLAYDLGLKIFYDQTTFYRNKPEVIANTNPDIVISQNSSYEAIESLDNLKALHVIRDPRDLLISSYYSSLYSHNIEGWPELSQLRIELEKTTFDNGLILVMDFMQSEILHMKTWNYNDPRILEFKFETFIENPIKHLNQTLAYFDLIDHKEKFAGSVNVVSFGNRVFNRVGLYNKVRFKKKKVSGDYAEQVNKKLSFKSLSKGRDRGQENKTSHYRSGKPGEWKNSFKKEHIDHFHSLFDDLLIAMGYENSENWNY